MDYKTVNDTQLVSKNNNNRLQVKYAWRHSSDILTKIFV